MKNIIVLFYRMEMGGSEMALLAFLRALVNNGHKVTLLLLEKQGPTLNRIPKEVTVEELHFNSDVLKKLAGNRIIGTRFFYVKRAIAKGLRCIFKQDEERKNLYPFLLKHLPERMEHYDLMFDYYGYGEFMTAYGAEKINADKKAVWFHDEKIEKYWGNGKVNKYLYKYQKLFCVSAAVKKALDDYYPEFSNKTEVLMNFIDTKEIEQKAEQTYLSNEFTGSYKILSVGRLTEQKGIDLAIRTAAILKKTAIDFQWYVIGEGRLYQELSKLNKEMGTEDRFHLLGKRENPYPYLHNCDLYVQPSRHEGYSIAIIEAKTLCRPIIASNIPSNREQIVDQKNGLLAELDENDLAKQISMLYYNPTLARRLTDELKTEKQDYLSEYSKLQRFMDSPD